MAKKYEELSIKSAKQSTLVSGIIDKGDLLVEAGFTLSSSYGFLDLVNGNIHLSSYSRIHIIPTCDEDEPNAAALRAIIKKIINHHHFDWLIFFNEDPVIFKMSIPDQNWIDLIENAGLFNLADTEVLTWWQEILKKYQDYSDIKKREIGDVGEKLSYEHEIDRLTRESFDKSYLHVKWASKFSDSFGYDVLSIRGLSLKEGFGSFDKIQIEVKSSVLSSEDNFRFRMTRNEWNHALKNIDSYYFHCWTGINLERGSAEKGPFIIPAKVLSLQVPIEKSSNCEWTECKFTVDLTKLPL